MKKNLTVYDATKEELIQYFFQPDAFGGGFRIPAMKDEFILWLQKKRNGELLDASNASSYALRKSLREYIDYIKKANDEPDIDKKMVLFAKANEAYERYEKASKQYDDLQERITEALSIND